MGAIGVISFPTSQVKYGVYRLFLMAMYSIYIGDDQKGGEADYRGWEKMEIACCIYKVAISNKYRDMDAG